MDTIFALASARGRAGVAVIRISGTRAHEAVRALAGDVPPNRAAALRSLRWHGTLLDEALVLVFAKGASFTGEASAELQVHGGVAVVGGVLKALGEMPGLRMAVAGEFTRRALENGNLDLSQVEGLADLIDAETEAQRLQAQRVLSGAIGARVAAWRAILVEAVALIEATIDFADEDVPMDTRPEVASLVSGLANSLRRELDGLQVAERVRDGFEVAIVGVPNAGKSTLLNRLAGRDAALTSPEAGTTRDVIEVRMDLRGVPVTLLDTAGLRDATDVIEVLGVERARSRAASADLRVFLLDQDGRPPGLDVQAHDILVHGKADLRSHEESAVSGVTGAGIDRLLDQIEATLADRMSRTGVLTRDRHRHAVQRALKALDLARDALEEGRGTEFIAEELRHALLALEELLGRVNVEEVLGAIFSRFCVGK